MPATYKYCMTDMILQSSTKLSFQSPILNCQFKCSLSAHFGWSLHWTSFYYFATARTTCIGVHIYVTQIAFTVLVNLGISFLNFSGSSLAPAFQYSYSIHASSGICASAASIHCPSAGANGTTPVSSTY